MMLVFEILLEPHGRSVEVAWPPQLVSRTNESRLAMGYSAWPDAVRSLVPVAMPSQRPSSGDWCARPSMPSSHSL